MQLDKTVIAVRERNQIEILDMSLHACRENAGPLLIAMAFGVAPFAVFNGVALGWMLDVSRQDFSGWEYFWRMVRYVWLMSLLVFIQAPLASVFATSYLGRALFYQSPSWREVAGEVWKYAPQLLWNQLIVRGVAPAMLLLLVLDRQGDYNPLIEIFAIGGLAAYAALVRSIRPFMNEIVLLEKNPFRSPDRNVVTVGRRSNFLHGPSTGDLFQRWVGAAAAGAMLCMCFYGAMRFLTGVFLNDWWEGIFPGSWKTYVCLPLAMWLTAAYFCVVRYLSYQDLRIRHEGWEVELGLKAEAGRLHLRLKGEKG